MKIGKMEKIVSAIAIVAVVSIGSSYWVGSQVEQKFRESVDWASKHGIPVSMVDYQRGVFGATARTDAIFPVPFKENASVTVTIIHTVEHGPLSVLTAAARIHSEVQPTEDNIEQFREIFESDMFPVLDTVIGWSGGQSLHITSPKFEATIKDIKGIELESDTTPVEEGKRVFSSTASIMLGTLYLQGISDNGANYGVEFENIRVAVASSMKGGVLGTGELKIDADRVVAEREAKETIDNLSLTFLIENLDVEAIDTGFQAMQDGSEGLEQATIQLLQHRPVFAIKDARVRWPEGMATGNFRIAYVGNPNSNPSLTDWSCDLKMALPRALVVRHLSAQTGKEISDELEGGEENEIDIGKETKEQVDKQITAMLNKGIFVEEGGTLSVDARLRDGKLSLNGKAQPFEFLLELLPPFL